MYKRLDAKSFELDYGALYNELFCGSSPRKASFRKQGWDFALTYRSFRWDKVRFSCICDAINFIGDDEIIITSLQFQPIHRWSVSIKCAFEWHVEAMRDPDLVHLLGSTKAMFSRSGRWGAIVDEGLSSIGGYALFGGDHLFISEFIRLNGGKEKMKGDFTRLINDTVLDAVRSSELGNTLLLEIGWN